MEQSVFTLPLGIPSNALDRLWVGVNLNQVGYNLLTTKGTKKMYDVMSKVINKGEKVHVSINGQVFLVECVGSTVIDYERIYRVRYSDGSEQNMRADQLMSRVN